MADSEPANEVVLRRAFELAASAPTWVSEHRLSHEELAEIAAEVGLPLEALATALAEEAAHFVDDESLLDRLVGPSEIARHRVAASDEVKLREGLVDWLEAGHGLRPRTTMDGMIVADRRSGVIGKLGRGVRSVQGMGGLGRVKGVRGAVVDVGDGAICLVVDVTDRRRNALLGGGAVATGGTIAAGALTLLTPLALVGIPVSVGVGLLTSRVAYKASVDDVEKTLEQTLDGIAIGLSPPGVLDGIGRGLSRQLKRGSDPRTSGRGPRPGISRKQLPPPPPDQ